MNVAVTDSWQCRMDRHDEYSFTKAINECLRVLPFLGMAAGFCNHSKT